MAKILIVEDDKALSAAYRAILKHEGHDVITASNGEEGLEKATAYKPKVILLDLLMPVMNGIEFLRRYNAKKHPGVYVIVLTNFGADASVQEALERGAYKYILKAHASSKQLATLVKHLINKNIVPKPVEKAV